MRKRTTLRWAVLLASCAAPACETGRQDTCSGRPWSKTTLASGPASPGLVNVDDVRNGLTNGASTGRDNGGPGLPAGAARNPSAGAYFNDGRDGEFRGRTENLFARALGTEIHLAPSNHTPPSAGDPRAVGPDFRGLGAQTPGGSLVNLDDVTNGLSRSADDSRTIPVLGFLFSRKGRSDALASMRPKAWQKSSLAPHSCRLAVGDNETLPLDSTDVSVLIEGFRARVEIDFVFRNDRDHRLEGSFDLRLPEGASPHALAFGELKARVPAVPGQVAATVAAAREERASSWEKPKEARMVPREKAAYGYTDTVKKKADPALLEWSGAGVFSTRVFPLEPGKRHRISIAYDIDLVPDGDDLAYRLDLPDATGDLDVRMEVGSGEADVAPAAPREGRARHWHQPTTRTFAVRLHERGPVLLEGEDPAAGPLFAVQVRPDLPQAPARATDRALFLVDASWSASPDAFALWLSLLEQILAKNRLGACRGKRARARLPFQAP